MDWVCEVAEKYALKPYLYEPLLQSYPKLQLYFGAEDIVYRECFTLWLTLLVGAVMLYFSVAGFFYYYLFVRNRDYYYPNMKEEPNVRHEIWRAVSAMPTMSMLTVMLTYAEIKGHSKLYWEWDMGMGALGYVWLVLSPVVFILFTDCLVYFIHGWILHYPPIYQVLHKDHHHYVKSMSPFASHAFHPVDGVMQSVPYHLFVYLFPMQRYLYLGMFVVVNFWTISIHDMHYVSRWWWLNGAAHHSLHHVLFNYNHGQYTVLWDWLFGTYKDPMSVKRSVFQSEPWWFREKAKLEKPRKKDKGA